MKKNETRFIVLLVLCGGGSWQPVFREDDIQMIFKSREDAQQEINKCIEGTVEAVEMGNMDEAYTQDDYVIAPCSILNQPDNISETMIEVTTPDGYVYMMLLTDDDFTVQMI